ncbi:MAG: plasmid partitioning protein RepB [Hyphomicrobiales bacterium]|jgi:ParB family chromosome partitioning protein|nr:MAG: plasmid partitioning protein RepB [Hyphomicrobiales bacterium]
MSRKDTLRALLGARERELPSGNSPEPVAEAIEAPRQLVRSGAVGAMGRSLGKLTHAAEEARALIASGDTIVQLDAALIESSFLEDRLGEQSEEHAALVASIREHGQQVPILVRPHPGKAGRYQVAYGHRRLRALAELGRPVRAIVREMSDAGLIVAQGQENSARLQLSYIERAMFAVSIEDQGFDREVIMAALTVEKTQLSRLISIGRAIPFEVVKLIGPAPKTGRPRWAALAEKIAGRDLEPILVGLSAKPDFLTADSDARFARLLSALTPAPVESCKRSWCDEDGRRIATYQRGPERATLTLDQKIAPDFGEYVLSQLPQLYRSYRGSRGTG